VLPLQRTSTDEQRFGDTRRSPTCGNRRRLRRTCCCPYTTSHAHDRNLWRHPIYQLHLRTGFYHDSELRSVPPPRLGAYPAKRHIPAHKFGSLIRPPQHCQHNDRHTLYLFIKRPESAVHLFPVDPPLFSDHSFLVVDVACPRQPVAYTPPGSRLTRN
jgi:hypothetical protein